MSRKITLLACLLTGTTLFAQKDTVTLDEVVVTANKLEQKQSTTGKVITVITKEQIEKSGGKTISQLLNEQAGITINGAFNNAGSVQTVYTRGASPGRTLVLMDGIPLNDPSTITTDFDLNFFSVNDVERIEVCKGPQSTLYGSDAIAGVINIITVKKDTKKPFNIKATLSQGSLGTSRNNVQVFGKAVSLPTQPVLHGCLPMVFLLLTIVQVYAIMITISMTVLYPVGNYPIRPATIWHSKPF